MVVTCTGGERGSILNPAMDRPGVLDDMPAIRRAEMARAAEILGVSHRWLGYVDSGLPEGDPLPPLPEGCFALGDLDEQVGALVAVIREFRPHVLVTYDERGGYPHPDHIRCHEISVAAFDAAGDPDRYPDAGEPWQPLKLYYSHGFSRARMEAFHAALLARGLESPYGEWLANWSADTPDPGARVTTRVQCADWFPVRDEALLAHATQIDPDEPLVPRARTTCSARSGRPRTTSWSARWSSRRCRKTTCSPGSRSSRRSVGRAERLLATALESR